MDQTPNMAALDNPWRRIDQFPRVPIIMTVLSILAVFASSIGLAFPNNNMVGAGVLLFLFFYVAYTARTLFPILLLLCSTGVVCALGEMNYAIGACFLSLVVGSAAFAWLMTTCRNGTIAFLPVTAGFLVAYFCGQTDLAILAFAFLPTALLMALTTWMAKRRTTVLCASAAGLVAVIALFAFVLLTRYSREAGLSISEYVTLLREQLTDSLVGVRDELIALYEQAGVQDEAVLEQFRTYYTRENISAMLSGAINLLPAAVCVLASIVAYEAQLLLNAAYHSAGWDAAVPLQARVLTMGLPAAILFLASGLISMLGGGTVSLFMAVVENLYLILLPGFFVLGMNAVVGFLHAMKMAGKSGFFFGLMALLCCFSTGVGLSIVPLWGAYMTISIHMHNRALQKGRGYPRGVDDTDANPHSDEDDQNSNNSNDSNDSDGSDDSSNSAS